MEVKAREAFRPVEGVAYIKAVSKSIPLPRGRAISPSRSSLVVLAC